MKTTTSPKWIGAALAAIVVALAGGCGSEERRLLGLELRGTAEAGFTVTPSQPLYAYAWGIYSDGSREDVVADWVSSSTTVATVTVDPYYYTVTVRAVSPGRTVLTATYQDVSGSVTLTVPEP